MSELSVSRILGKSPRVLKRWRQEGKGPPYTRIGQSTFYREASFESWLLAKEIDPSKPTKLTRRSRKVGS
ncbi:MAG: helix-turn-helix domain-containing protein [Pseudomonadota bacterium]|nr:helix-turn-helix domain-containing protein [Pseudomonadota bacterium]